MTHAAALERLLGPHLTLDEWRDLPEDVPGELVESRLVEEEMPDPWHELIVAWLAPILGNWADDAIVLGSETRFALSSTHGRKPDLTVYLGGRRPPARGVVDVPPDIAVEVVSPSPRDQRRDRQDKMVAYAAFGIPFYWIVDPQQRCFEIYGRSEANTYAARVQAAGGIVQPVPGCPGLAIDLDAMWAKVDSLNG
jgi:Uma2 family endonuclease